VINDICSHEFFISPFVHSNPTIQNQNSKIKVSQIINSLSYVLIYKKRDERQREKEEKKRGETEEIKIKIRSSQFQMTIFFNRKLRLRRVAWLQKIYDEIYMINVMQLRLFSGQKKSRLQAQKRI
jgi:hypothetical protein